MPEHREPHPDIDIDGDRPLGPAATFDAALRAVGIVIVIVIAFAFLLAVAG